MILANNRRIEKITLVVVNIDRSLVSKSFAVYLYGFLMAPRLYIGSERNLLSDNNDFEGIGFS